MNRLLPQCFLVLLLSLGMGFGTPSEADAGRRKVGLMFGAGVPDGVNSALVWRPTPRIRAHGGVAYNGFAPGVRGGISLAAIPFWITPSVSVEAGRFFSGNANLLAQMVSGDTSFDELALRDIGYDFANAHLGIELGYEDMTFYLHGGMSAVQMSVRNVDDFLALAFESDEGPKIEVRSDPKLRLFAPSARTGFVYYF